MPETQPGLDISIFRALLSPSSDLTTIAYKLVDEPPTFNTEADTPVNPSSKVARLVKVVPSGTSNVCSEVLLVVESKLVPFDDHYSH